MSIETEPHATRPSGSRLARAAAVGLVAGFLSGLFGVGGGILIVPALVLVMAMDQRLAHGTSLAAVLPIAVSSTLGYALEDKVDWPVAARCWRPRRWGSRRRYPRCSGCPSGPWRSRFSGLLVVTAVRLLIDHSNAGGRGGLDAASVIGLLVLGHDQRDPRRPAGVGGGIIMVPAMVVLWGSRRRSPRAPRWR